MPRKVSRPRRLDKPAVGDLVHLAFYDHAEYADEPCHFEVFGRILTISPLAYKVGFWLYVNDVDRAKDNNKENENYFIIVRSTITYLKILK